MLRCSVKTTTNSGVNTPVSDQLQLVVKDLVATLTISRPDKLNALTDLMLDELRTLCREIEHRSDIRVVIITGAGDRSFSAGGDITAWSDKDATSFSRHWVRDGHDAFDALARLRQPTIAVLNGHTLGGGLELAMLADLRIAEKHVKLGQPETSLGIIPGWSGTQRAVRRIGSQLIRRMALFGEVFTAEQGLLLGLVDEVVESGDGHNRAMHVAAKVLRLSPTATELTKMLINASEGEERERVLEALAGRVAAASDDLQEGLKAFAEKRSPDFNHHGEV